MRQPDTKGAEGGQQKYKKCGLARRKRASGVLEEMVSSFFSVWGREELECFVAEADRRKAQKVGSSTGHNSHGALCW